METERLSEKLMGAEVEFYFGSKKQLKRGRVIGSDPRPLGCKEGDYVVIRPDDDGLTETQPAGAVTVIRKTPAA